VFLYVLYWNFETIYGGQGPSRYRVIVPARQATQPGGIGSLESILGLLKTFKKFELWYFSINAHVFHMLFKSLLENIHLELGLIGFKLLAIYIIHVLFAPI
jgi:hypothetical protein